jgi:hypothetical protein
VLHGLVEEAVSGVFVGPGAPIFARGLTQWGDMTSAAGSVMGVRAAAACVTRMLQAIESETGISMRDLTVHVEAPISIGVGATVRPQYADLVFVRGQTVVAVVDLFFTTLAGERARSKLRSLRFLGFAAPVAAFRASGAVVAAISFLKPVLYAADYAYSFGLKQRTPPALHPYSGRFISEFQLMSGGLSTAEWIAGHFAGGVIYADGLEKGDHLIVLKEVRIQSSTIRETWHAFQRVVIAQIGGELYLVLGLAGYGIVSGARRQLMPGARLLDFGVFFADKERLAADVSPSGERSSFTAVVYAGALGERMAAEKASEEDVEHA